MSNERGGLGTQKLLPEIWLAQDTSDMMPYGQSTLANRPQKVGDGRGLINTPVHINTWYFLCRIYYYPGVYYDI